MAQNSDALQEPSMDELLASIREIIEENTGVPSQEGNSATYSGHSAQADNAAQGQNRNYDTMASGLKQDIRVRTDKAAAPANRHGPGNFAQNSTVLPQMGRGSIMPQNTFNNSQQNQNSSYNGGRLMPEVYNARSPNGAAAQGNRPAQDSMNALAERIGLSRNGSPVVHDGGQNELSDQVAGPHISSAPSAAQMQGNFAANGSDSGQNGRVPFARANNIGSYDRHNNGRQANTAEGARPRFNPAAMATSYRDGEEPQIRERSADSESEENGRATAARAQHAPSSQREKEKLEHRVSRDNLYSTDSDKHSSADVERSAESLLRPFIAEWLDEHFRDLFEKILREEVQRFIQSIRRN